jgi:aconitate hydratase 2 / 2-methylisocitrate dehydratase
MLEEYRIHVEERKIEGVPPLSLNSQQVTDLIELLKNPPAGEEDFLLDLITNRVPAGVDEAAAVKAEFLSDITRGNSVCPLIDRVKAVELLGTMLGGYNIKSILDALDDNELAPEAVKALSHTLLMFDAFYDVKEKAEAGNSPAQQVLQSWADAEWFTSSPKLAEKITVTIFKVPGETNTDDLSPATDAWSRPDIPLHANVMLRDPRPGLEGNALDTIAELKKKGYPVAYVGDVVGTGSSRKSATNSVLWHTGIDIPFIPNKRAGGYVLGGKIAPIFFNTMEDAGALPIECDVSKIATGDVVDIFPYEGIIKKNETGEEVSIFSLKTDVLIDEVQAGGRIPLIIGRGLTARAREALGLSVSDIFRTPAPAPDTGKGYTLAQKIVGHACGVEGVRPGGYCEPKMTTVCSQDTTGPMTRDELKDLACLGFSADFVLQSFCHTAAYPKPVDVEAHQTLPSFFSTRSGVALRPGDGVVHSWLNRMLIPDTVGTGGDSHTRFPIGLSFPAGSGLVAFAAATGVMPLDMPESVLVRFTGEMQPGITLRDLVNAIPYCAIEKGMLTVAKEGKKNIFSGRIVEIEGLPDLKVEQAFELSDSSAERSAAACTIKLNKESVVEFLTSNIVLLKWMIAEGYQDRKALERRIEAMEKWLENPEMLVADDNAEYAEVLEIDMTTIKEPILACPNDPDNVKLLSEVTGENIDEVFIGSCMTNIGHFRAAGKLLDGEGDLPTRLWIAPPTIMDKQVLTEEGYYSIYGRSGARIEIPGCSLCMGNQARVRDNATVVATSTRNFPNRLGTGANVYLSSAELAAVAAILGRLPSVEEYMDRVKNIAPSAAEIYRCSNFDQIDAYKNAEEIVNGECKC